MKSAFLTTWGIGLMALILTVAVGAISHRIQASYTDTHSFYYDPVSNLFRHARLSVLLERGHGRFELAAEEWNTNANAPLRTAPLILLGPKALTAPFGHIVVALLALLPFLFLLGQLARQRTGSTAYALAAMTFFCALPGVYDPYVGYGAFWLDFPAALLSACAVICLLSSDRTRDRRWVAAFAAFAAIAVLCRYNSSGLLFVTCAPILAWDLGFRFRREPDGARAVCRTVLLIGGIIALIAGYTFIRNVVYYWNYYRSGYAGFKPVADALAFMQGSLRQLVGTRALAVLGLAFACHLFAAWRRGRLDVAQAAKSMWIAIAIPLFFVLVIRQSGSLHAYLFVLPLLVLSALAGIPHGPAVGNGRNRVVAAAVLFLASAAIARSSLVTHWHTASNANEEVSALKRYDVELAEKLTGEGADVVWKAFFEEREHAASMEAFRRYGKLPLAAGGGFFTWIEHNWRLEHPGLSPAEVSAKVRTAADGFIDVAVVLTEPERVRDPKLFDNDYGRTVAVDMARHVSQGGNWTKVFELRHPRFGLVAGFRNGAATRGRYERLLRGLQPFTWEELVTKAAAAR